MTHTAKISVPHTKRRSGDSTVAVKADPRNALGAMQRLAKTSAPVQRLAALQMKSASADPENPLQRVKVKTKTGGKYSELEEKLNKTQVQRDVEAHHDPLIATARQTRERVQAEKEALIAQSGDPKVQKTKAEKQAFAKKIQPKIAEVKQADLDLAKAEKAKRDALAAGPAAAAPNMANSAGMSFVERHRKVLEAAKAADPLMETLQSGGDLSATHSLGGATTPFAVGAAEFKNSLPDASRGAPLLPELTHSGIGTRGDSDALSSTHGAWGEADIFKSDAGKRDANRLLHTQPSSKALGREVGKGKREKASKVDSQFYLSVDHYESAIPMSPVATGYTRERSPMYDVQTDGPSSLEQYEAAQQEELARQENSRKLQSKLRAMKDARRKRT